MYPCSSTLLVIGKSVGRVGQVAGQDVCATSHDVGSSFPRRGAPVGRARRTCQPTAGLAAPGSMIRPFRVLAFVLLAACAHHHPPPAGPVPQVSVWTGEAGETCARDSNDDADADVDSDDDGDTVAMAGGSQTCAPGATCSFDCPAGGCAYYCADGSTCNIDCGGGNCRLGCGVGATCNLDCEGGRCGMGCAGGATCNTDCEGGSCAHACAAGATCNTDCDGGNCS